MKNREKKTEKPMTLVIMGLVAVPMLSFGLVNLSPESPLYTSISRIAWVHGQWFATFLWAVMVMAVILLLTYRMTATGPLGKRTKTIFLVWQAVNIALVFLGCVMFPAKGGLEDIRFVNYLHDYLTAVAWILYGVGLVVYSALLCRKDRFLGFLGLGLMAFVFLSSVFFLLNVVDPSSYVGASAVSEVYIINSLIIYLVVMYVAQLYTNKIRELMEG